MKIFDQIETVKDQVERANLSPLEDEIRRHILRWFARRGRAPALQEIAESLKASPSTVKGAVEKLENADILLTEGGEIVSAYPFSALETTHRVVFEDGRSVYALCATDALGVHFMLGEDITVLSLCPYCGRELKIELRNGGIEACEPGGIIMYVAIVKKCGCSAETLCPFINFFCSEEHLSRWKGDNPEYSEGEVYSLAEAMHYAKIIFGSLLK